MKKIKWKSKILLPLLNLSILPIIVISCNKQEIKKEPAKTPNEAKIDAAFESMLAPFFDRFSEEKKQEFKTKAKNIKTQEDYLKLVTEMTEYLTGTKVNLEQLINSLNNTELKKHLLGQLDSLKNNFTTSKLELLEKQLKELQDLEQKQEIETYKLTHAEILAKTQDSVTLEDEAKVTAALEAYNLLNEQTKAALTSEKTLLEQLLAKISNLKQSPTTSPNDNQSSNNNQTQNTSSSSSVSKQELQALIQKVQDPDKKNFYTFRLQYSSDSALVSLKTEVQRTIDQETQWANDASPAEKRSFSFQKLEQAKAVEKIKNKSFSVGYGFVLANGDNPALVHNGTGWLLDFAWDSKKENLMLYIATNLHVHRYAYNSADTSLKDVFPEYFTDSKMSTNQFYLGVPKANINLDPIPNYTQPSVLTNGPSIYTNAPDERSRLNGTTSVGDIISTPKTIFAAIDIYDQATNQQMKENWFWHPEPQYTDERMGLDFAVFGIEVNYKKLTEKQNEYPELKAHIDNAIKELENEIQTIKHGNDSLYIPFDYVSSYLKDGANKLKSLRPERLYVGGYPQVGNNGVFMSNTSTDLDHTVVVDRNTFTNNIINERVFDDKRAVNGIGYSFAMTNSSLAGGTSGSMVTNEYGVPVGIYNTSTNINGTDLSKRSGFVPLIQTEDLQWSYAYNLIDGSDKTRYPKQEKSYRQNLAKNQNILTKYPTTALFPNGVKNN